MKWPWKKEQPKIQFKDPRRNYPPKPEPVKPVEKVEVPTPPPAVFNGYDLFGYPLYGPPLGADSVFGCIMEALMELIPVLGGVALAVLFLWVFW